MPHFAVSSRIFAGLVCFAAVARAQPIAELGNLSARMRLASGGSPVVVGAVLAGEGNATLLVRAVGPGLAGFGVSGVLADPRLTVFGANGSPISTNDNWESEAGGAAVREAAAQAGAFALAPGAADAAALVRVGAGALTVQVTWSTGEGGVVLVELYTVGPSTNRLVNLSLLADAGSGDEVLTAGFVVRGGVLPVLVRGVGPGLGPLGVVGAVADPRLTVFDATGAVLTANNDWDVGGMGTFVRRTAEEVGAFALAAGSRDAAGVVTLGPGAYTVHLASGSGAGRVLAEVYAAEPEMAEINGSLRGQPGNIQDNVFQSLCIDPHDSRTVYVGTETNGMFKTTDGGATWTRLRRGLRLDPNRLGYPQVYEIAVDPADPRVVYAATVAAPGPATGAGVEVLRSGVAGVYKSTDGGQTWRQRIAGFASTYTPHVVISPRDRRTLYAGIGGARSMEVFYDGGLLVSRDGADSWQAVAVAPGTVKNTPVSMRISVRDGNETLDVSYMVHGTDFPTAYGLHRTTDGGRTWQARNPEGLVVENFDVFQRDNAIIYANDGTLRRIHKSADGGLTWTRTPLGNYGPIRISPTDANIVFFTGFTTIMKSSDGLNSARTVLDDTAYLNGRQFMDIKVSERDPAIVWAAAKGYLLYRSTDGGERFERVTAVRELVYGAGN